MEERTQAEILLHRLPKARQVRSGKHCQRGTEQDKEAEPETANCTMAESAENPIGVGDTLQTMPMGRLEPEQLLVLRILRCA